MKKNSSGKLLSLLLALCLTLAFLPAISAPASAATYTSGSVSLSSIKAGDILFNGVVITVTSDQMIYTTITVPAAYSRSGAALSEETGGGANKGQRYTVGTVNGSAYSSNNTFSPITENPLHWTMNRVETSPSSSGHTNFTLHLVGMYGYDITYNYNGGSGSPADATGVSGSTTLPTPNGRTGYDFAGWYTAASGGSYVGGGGSSYTPGSNITLFAHWTIHQHALTFTSGLNITAIGGETSGGNINYNTSVTLTPTIATSTGDREYHFSSGRVQACRQDQRSTRPPACCSSGCRITRSM